MAYDLFLFDLDDTLLDFRASEKLSFERSLTGLSVPPDDALFATYQIENRKLWSLFEQGKTTKEDLKVERFRKTFEIHGVKACPERASLGYLRALPETVVLMDHAVEILQWLHRRGEVGILTNGIKHSQAERIKNSPLHPYISFVSVSEDCGFAKPDVRFFEYSVKLARSFKKSSAIMIGDRWEADILGAQAFGLDSVWFNPAGKKAPEGPGASHEIRHLSELRTILG